MKKLFVTLFFIFSIFGLNFFCNKSLGYLHLNNLDFDATINSDATMNVTETWNIRIENTNTLFKEFKTDSSKYSKISNVKVSEIRNSLEQPLEQIDQLMYHVTKNCYYGMKNDNGNFEIAWGVGLDDSSDTRTYKISYTVYDAVKKYSDYAELYWQFIGSDFGVNASNITGKIRLPSYVETKEEIKVWGHTEDLNGEIYATSLNTIEFNINQFRSGRFVEVRTLFPNYLITSSNRVSNDSILEKAIEEETNWANAANLRRQKNEKMKKNATIFYIVVSFLACILLINNIKKQIIKYKQIVPYSKTIDIDYYREMPRNNVTPSQSLSMLNKKIEYYTPQEIGRIFSATLLDFNLEKYIDFEQLDKKNLKIKLLEKRPENMPESKKAIYDFIEKSMGTEKQITVKELEKYIKKYPSRIEKLKKSIDIETKEEIIKLGLFDENRQKERESDTFKSSGLCMLLIFILGVLATFLLTLLPVKIVLIPIIVFIIFVIIDTIVAIRVYKKQIPFTNEGLNESEMWKGLKKYMEDFSMLDKREVPELVLWEKFLVYATAFGIADKVLKQLKIVYKDIYENMDTSTHAYMYMMMHTDFSTSFANSISSSVASSYSSTLSSGSGGGGGFSGGGGGGRRPEVGGGRKIIRKN